MTHAPVVLPLFVCIHALALHNSLIEGLPRSPHFLARSQDKYPAAQTGYSGHEYGLVTTFGKLTSYLGVRVRVKVWVRVSLVATFDDFFTLGILNNDALLLLRQVLQPRASRCY